ncbi:Proline--tRNA ligase [Lachnellula occidentalis]|uniref:proline--tRNA ligase n=1 Tax=Lachnellula occidentalis TaxID=215460 RepID=A0A8H8S5D4_9HELO|nr:Proline--tRNA ligase [Lachnellula occidentalis]
MRYTTITPFPASLRPRATRLSTCCFANTAVWAVPRPYERFQTRHAHSSPLGTDNDGRSRLSRLWAPSGGISPTAEEDSHSMLIRAGFLRQAHSGLFHMLPLGQRVQKKLEALIDKHMSTLNASKLDLSSISSESLWERSGRLKSIGSELFRFRDRKDTGYLLSPTHEEEITTLVTSTTTSYKDLPVRVYQISRKYRDELRPRHGLLRSREFIMKDLYTFDYSSPQALSTYNQVREAYARLFDELKIPYLVAEADSGDMGGNLSHEFHFPTAKGEDHVISCTNCEYVANEELAEGPVLPSESTENDTGPLADVSTIASAEAEALKQLSSWQGISKDRSTLFTVFFMPSALSSSNPASDVADGREVNVHAIKAAFPEIDNSVENPLDLWIESDPHPENNAAPARPRQHLNILDGSISDSLRKTFAEGTIILSKDPSATLGSPHQLKYLGQHPVTGEPFNLLRVKNGDRCPRCLEGHVKINKAIELGHTFHLGSRYTKQLEGHVTVPYEIIKNQEADFEFLPTVKESSSGRQVVIQMGCHGIGVSRMIGAVADTLADKNGLNWPRIMAPFEAIVVANKSGEEGTSDVYDAISQGQSSGGTAIDLVLDDRAKPFAWKMKDADLVGYPVIVVVGRRWAAERICEVQCRRLKLKEDVHIADLSNHVRSLLERL